MITIDLETEAIQPRPKYPPVPVGVSIMRDDREPRYYAWGHPTENNCTKSEAAKVLKDIWRNASRTPILGQNLKFDLEVALEHFGLAIPAWHDFHDELQRSALGFSLTVIDTRVQGEFAEQMVEVPREA